MYESLKASSVEYEMMWTLTDKYLVWQKGWVLIYGSRHGTWIFSEDALVRIGHIRSTFDNETEVVVTKAEGHPHANGISFSGQMILEKMYARMLVVINQGWKSRRLVEIEL
jgi:hypothetical protein